MRGQPGENLPVCLGDRDVLSRGYARFFLLHFLYYKQSAGNTSTVMK